MRLLIELSIDEAKQALTTGIIDQLAEITNDKIQANPTKPAKQAKPKPDQAAAEVLTEEKKEEPEIKMEDVRAKLNDLNKAGKRAEIQALFAKYGAKKFTDIAQSDYASLLAEAEAL